MFRVHRLGHIEAKSLELVLSESSLRMAQQSYKYLSLGFNAAIGKDIGIAVEGFTTVRMLPKDFEKLEQRLLIT